MSVRVASRKNGKKCKAEKTEKVKIEPATPSTSTSSDSPSTSTSNDSSATSSSTKTKIENINEEAGSSQATKREMETIPLSLPKFNPNKQARGHFGSSKRAFPTELAEDPSYKKTKKAYSVAKDPQSSEVYKSLFTSHRNDKEQTRAHWVTYNPFYN